MSRKLVITLLPILLLLACTCGMLPNLSQMKGLASTAEAVATSMPLSNPTGKPVSVWNNIPIYPQATAGQEYNKDTYGFTTNSNVVDVHAFYADKLKGLGWTFVTDTSNLIIAQKDKSILEMNILPGNAGTTVILILH